MDEKKVGTLEVIFNRVLLVLMAFSIAVLVKPSVSILSDIMSKIKELVYGVSNLPVGGLYLFFSFFTVPIMLVLLFLVVLAIGLILLAFGYKVVKNKQVGIIDFFILALFFAADAILIILNSDFMESFVVSPSPS